MDLLGVAWLTNCAPEVDDEYGAGIDRKAPLIIPRNALQHQPKPQRHPAKLGDSMAFFLSSDVTFFCPKQERR